MNNIKFNYIDPLYNVPRTLIVKGEFCDNGEILSFKVASFMLREFILTAKAMGLDVSICGDEVCQPEENVKLPVGVQTEVPTQTDFNPPSSYTSNEPGPEQTFNVKQEEPVKMVDPSIPNPVPSVELQPSRVLPNLVNKETEQSFTKPLDTDKSPNQNVVDIIRGELESELDSHIRKESIELDLEVLGLTKCYLTDLKQENILYVDKILEENGMHKVTINDFTYSFPDKNNIKLSIFNKTDNFRFIAKLVEDTEKHLQLDLCENFKT